MFKVFPNRLTPKVQIYGMEVVDQNQGAESAIQ